MTDGANVILARAGLITPASVFESVPGEITTVVVIGNAAASDHPTHIHLPPVRAWRRPLLIIDRDDAAAAWGLIVIPAEEELLNGRKGEWRIRAVTQLHPLIFADPAHPDGWWARQ